MIKTLKRKSLIIISIFFIFCCSLFFSTRTVKAECTSYFSVCNTCVIATNLKIKAAACVACTAAEVACQVIYGPRK